MPKFSLVTDLCTHCATCVRVCPKGLIDWVDGAPVMTEEKSTKCNNCGQCVAFCPTGAAEHTFAGNGTRERATQLTEINPEFVLRFLKSRRSYRTFDPRALSQETIEKILEAANFAPSGGNNRTIRWIVTTNPQKTRAIGQMIANWFDTTCRTHPVYSKRYAIDSILERFRAGKDTILRGAPHLAYCVGPETAVWGAVDTGIALTYFNLAAESMNVGCCFAGYATASAQSKEFREALGLKEGERVWCALCFGQKTIQGVRIPNRPEVPVTYLD